MNLHELRQALRVLVSQLPASGPPRHAALQASAAQLEAWAVELLHARYGLASRPSSGRDDALLFELLGLIVEALPPGQALDRLIDGLAQLRHWAPTTPERLVEQIMDCALADPEAMTDARRERLLSVDRRWGPGFRIYSDGHRALALALCWPMAHDQTLELLRAPSVLTSAQAERALGWLLSQAPATPDAAMLDLLAALGAPQGWLPGVRRPGVKARLVSLHELLLYAPRAAALEGRAHAALCALHTLREATPYLEWVLRSRVLGALAEAAKALGELGHGQAHAQLLREAALDAASPADLAMMERLAAQVASGETEAPLDEDAQAWRASLAQALPAPVIVSPQELALERALCRLEAQGADASAARQAPPELEQALLQAALAAAGVALARVTCLQLLLAPTWVEGLGPAVSQALMDRVLDAFDRGEPPGRAPLWEALDQALQRRAWTLTPAQRARLLAQDAPQTPLARQLWLLLTLPESESTWLQALDAQDDPSLGALLLTQRQLLALEPPEARARLWLAMMARCQESARRRLLDEVDLAQRPELLPAVATLMGLSGASTRQRLVERVAHAQLVAAEPALMRVAQDEREDLHVRRAALEGLARVGTRQGIALLRDAQRDRALREVALAAQRAIEARYPESSLKARAGALSMASPAQQLRGELSMMGLDPGAISLYEQVVAALDRDPEPSLALAQARQLALSPELARLGAPPRQLSPWILVAYVSLGTGATSQALYHVGVACLSVWASMTLGMSLERSPPLALLVGLLVASVVAALIGYARSARELRALRLGQLTQARVDPSSGTLTFQDEQGMAYALATPAKRPHVASSGHAALVDEQGVRPAPRERLAPVLYVPGREQEAIAVDALVHARVDPEGRLALTRRAKVVSVLYALTCFVAPLLMALKLVI